MSIDEQLLFLDRTEKIKLLKKITKDLEKNYNKYKDKNVYAAGMRVKKNLLHINKIVVSFRNETWKEMKQNKRVY